MKAEGRIECVCGIEHILPCTTMVLISLECKKCGSKIIGISSLGYTWRIPFNDGYIIDRPGIDLEFSDGTVDKQSAKPPRTKSTTIPDGWTGHHSNSELYFVDDKVIEDEITDTTLEDILG